MRLVDSGHTIVVSSVTVRGRSMQDQRSIVLDGVARLLTMFGVRRLELQVERGLLDYGFAGMIGAGLRHFTHIFVHILDFCLGAGLGACVMGLLYGGCDSNVSLGETSHGLALWYYKVCLRVERFSIIYSVYFVYSVGGGFLLGEVRLLA